MKTTAILFSCLCLVCLRDSLLAKTDLSYTTVNPAVTIPGETELEQNVQEIVNKNGPFISNSFAMGNLTGYPVGESHIGAFPHMQFGLFAGMGGTNMAYFDKGSKASSDGTMPGITPNVALQFGIGLTEKTDLLGKFFLLSDSILDPGLSTDMVTLQKYTILSVGGKFRYQIFGKQTILPFLFNFGGLTFSVGGDVMYGRFELTGDYDADYGNISIDWGAGATDVPLNFSSQYDGTILWGIFALSTQIVAYFEVFGIFQPYTGFGLAANYGYSRIKFNADGDLTTDAAGYPPAYAGKVADMTFLSKNAYTPYYVIPTYIVGLELNLWLMKITAETMANLYNLSDINAQLGVRFQF